MTDATPPQGRSVPIEGVLGRYREQLASVTEQLFIAREQADAAEAEAAQLRLRVIEFEQAQPAGKK